MKLQVLLKKVTVTTAIIKQIQNASQEDLVNQDEILGWCYFVTGSGITKRTRRLMLFKNSEGEIRKYYSFSEATISKKDIGVIGENGQPSGREERFLVCLDTSGKCNVNAIFYFDNPEDANEFKNLLYRLKRVAHDKGQFFI